MKFGVVIFPGSNCDRDMMHALRESSQVVIALLGLLFWNTSISASQAFGGHLLNLHRLDGAPAISSHIAPAKAHTAALGRRESKIYEDVINGGRVSFVTAPEVKGMLEGGVPIMKDGQCIGAVGVSGVKSNEDAQIAKAGIAAIGL